MYAITTADRLENIVFVADTINEAAEYLGISVFGVQSAIRRSKNPNSHQKYYKVFSVQDYEKNGSDEGVEEKRKTTPKSTMERSELVFDGFDERIARRHR